MTGFSFEGLEELETRIRRISRDSAAYITIADRTDRGSEKGGETTIARFELAADFLAAYTGAPATPPAPTTPINPYDADAFVDDDDDGDEYPGDDSGEATESTAEASSPLPVGPWARCLDTACEWMRGVITRHTIAEDRPRRFRVSIYRGKGQGRLDGGTVVCVNNRPPIAAEPEPLPVPELPKPDYKDMVEGSLACSMKQLGTLWTQYGETLLSSVGQIQRLQDGIVLRMDKRLASAERNQNALTDHIIQLRTREYEVDAETAVAHGKQARTEAALKRGISTLERLGEVYMMAKMGVPPQVKPLLPFLTKLTAHPDLLKALADPKVQAFVDDPANAAELAGLLAMVSSTEASDDAPDASPPPTDPAPAEGPEPDAADSAPSPQTPAAQPQAA